MDFRLTEDQLDLQAGIRSLLAGRFDRERLRAAVDGGGAFDPGLWGELAGAGLFALRVAEDGAAGSAGAAGGLGLGAAEAVLVFEEAGRALVPGPLVASELAVTLGVVPTSGDVGDAGRGLGAGVEGVAGVVRVPQGRGPLLVEQLPAVQVLLVLDVAAGEVRRVDPGDVLAGAREVRGVDPLTRLWEVAGPLPHGVVVAGADVARLWCEGTLLTAALQVGLAARAVESAVEYAKQREQFGQPIGAFQAVQHLCADMLGRLEPARVAVRAAAVALDATGFTPDTAAEVAGAKLLADDAAVHGARDCLQVHGGMGFTWEGDVHLLLKRAWVWQQSFAGAEECAELLAEQLL